MTKGKVYFIGAGCGDPEYMTIKAIKILQQANVILCDRLVSQDIINNYAPCQAEIVFVGKQAKHEASIPQIKINQLLIEKALKSKIVIRLKGGDISIFGNLLDELEALHQHNILYELIPGISAAAGAAACTGIPLTARQHATGVRFLTYYDKQILSSKQIKELASTTDTLVFYMSTKNIAQLIKQLSIYQKKSKKQVAIISQASTPFQHISVYGLHEFEKITVTRETVSPSLVIIGSVVGLYEKYKWLPNNEHKNQSYFKQFEQL